MNFKKVAFIPLMALLLVGCNANNGGKKGSDSGKGESSDIVEPEGEEVTLEQTKSALSQAATSLINQNNIGFDIADTAVEAHYLQRMYAGEMGFVDLVGLDAAVSDVNLKVRAENIQSENLDRDFKASVELGAGVDVKVKLPDEAASSAEEIKYATFSVKGNVAASAYLVGNEPYVNVPASNQTIIDQVVSLLTTLGAIDEAPQLPQLPIKYHLTNTGLSLNGMLEDKEDLVTSLEEMVDEIGEMPENYGTLKFIKESETLYAIYADINVSEPNTANINEVEYLLGDTDVKAKALLEFDTVKGIKSIAVEADVQTYTTYASSVLPNLEGELPEGMTKEILEPRTQVTTVKGQAKAKFCYGDNAKAEIPTDLNSYVDFSVNDESGEGEGEGQGE